MFKFIIILFVSVILAVLHMWIDTKIKNKKKVNNDYD